MARWIFLLIKEENLERRIFIAYMKGVRSEKQDNIGLFGCAGNILSWQGPTGRVCQTGNDLRKGEPDLTLSLCFLGAGGWGEQVSMNDPKKWWLTSHPPWKLRLCSMKCHFYLTWSTGTASSRQVSPELGALGTTGIEAPQKPGSSATDLQSWERMWFWALTSGVRAEVQMERGKNHSAPSQGTGVKGGL